MNTLVRTFEGKDLVIPRNLIEEMGVRPGEALVIRPRADLTLRSMTDEERGRRAKVLKESYGIWTADDEARFELLRREMWARWHPRNSS